MTEWPKNNFHKCQVCSGKLSEPGWTAGLKGISNTFLSCAK